MPPNHDGTNLNTCIIEQAQEVKRGKVNALFPINNHFVAWGAVKIKTLLLAERRSAAHMNYSFSLDSIML